MKTINIYPIKSELHNNEIILEARNKLLSELTTLSDFSFNIIKKDEINNSNLTLILIESGGSEKYFLDIYKVLKEPYIFLTYDFNNSLAASIEILSFLKQQNKDGEILHGDATYILKRLNSILKEYENE